MGASAAIMMVGSTVSGTYAQSQAAKAQGDFNKAQGDLNSQLADEAARDAITRGDNEAGVQFTKTRQLIGAQRAAAGASGADQGSGSNIQLQDEARAIGAIDMMTIKNNASREAFGYRIQAINQRTQGRIAKISGDAEAQSTLLVGGMSAAATVAKSQGKAGRPSTQDKSTVGFRMGRSQDSENAYSGWWRN